MNAHRITAARCPPDGDEFGDFYVNYDKTSIS